MISCFVRSVLLITEENKTNFDAYYVVIQTAHISMRSTVFLSQRKAFVKFSGDVNKILKRNKINHYNNNEIMLEKVWNQENPKRFVKYYYFCQCFSYGLWLLQTLHMIYWDEKNAMDSPLPFYNPLYKWGEFYKTFSVICDIICLTILFFQLLQPDIVTISLLNFGSCLFIYLKIVLKEMLGSDYSECNKRLWIKRHVEILNFMKELNNLLKPHIALQYTCQVAAVVLTLLSLLEVSNGF